MTDTKFISSDEFLARAEQPALSRQSSAADQYASKNGGVLFIGRMETKNQVQKFFDNLKECGVVVECEDNKVQKNYAPTIRLTFTKPSAILRAMYYVTNAHPDEMHYIDAKSCCFWWD